MHLWLPLGLLDLLGLVLLSHLCHLLDLALLWLQLGLLVPEDLLDQLHLSHQLVPEDLLGL